MENTVIRKAEPQEVKRVLAFYENLIEALQGPDSPIRWARGVYPVEEDIDRFIQAGEMYITETEGEILGAFALNHVQGEGYESVSWQVEADPEKVTVLHLLAVSPKVHKQGLGRKLLEEAVRLSREEGNTALRLDTLPFNKPGRRLYKHFGLTYCGDVTLFYPSTGAIDFSMYEYVL